MLLTPFSFIWLFQILNGYSKFLRNAQLRILFFFNWIFSKMLKLSMISHILSCMEATFSFDFRDVYSR